MNYYGDDDNNHISGTEKLILSKQKVMINYMVVKEIIFIFKKGDGKDTINEYGNNLRDNLDDYGLDTIKLGD